MTLLDAGAESLECARAVRSTAGVGMGAVPSAGAREGLGGR